ncbi:hypothetical protein ACFVZC_17270 [Streptomyces marokkonensis]|uniref:Uncharacterized protein n=1 Tax=Streptomyces marokkonensis TaxID=324855 RepID=A0ABW6Q7W3_9ACTN
MQDFMSLGADASGREVLVQRGGAIEGAATLEAASALHAVVATILEAGQGGDAELAALVAPLTDALGDVLGLFQRDNRAGAVQAMWRALGAEAGQADVTALRDALRASTQQP